MPGGAEGVGEVHGVEVEAEGDDLESEYPSN